MNNAYNELIKEGNEINQRHKMKGYVYKVFFTSLALIIATVVASLGLHYIISPLNLLENDIVMMFVLALYIFFVCRCFWLIRNESKEFNIKKVKNNFFFFMITTAFAFSLRLWEETTDIKSVFLIIIGKLIFLSIINVIIIMLTNLEKKNCWIYVLALTVIACIAVVIIDVIPASKIYNLILNILVIYSDYSYLKKILKREDKLLTESCYRRKMLCIFMTYIIINGIIV